MYWDRSDGTQDGVGLARLLLSQLAGEWAMVDCHALGRLTGQVMGFYQALPRARLCLTSIYSVTTGARLHDDADDRSSGVFKGAWWRKVMGTTVRPVRAEWRGPFREAPEDLINIVRHPDDGPGTNRSTRFCASGT